MASFQDARIQIAGNHLLIQRPSEVRSEEVIQDSAARSAQIVIQQQELKEKKEWLEQALGKIQENGDER